MNVFQQKRKEKLTHSEWDIIIIGGGATGLGAALDAVSRGYKTLLLEQADFAKGTSSRSTKLVHGGVRYLAQGDVMLVKKALRERWIMKKNAAHLVGEAAFIIPCYDWLSVLKYLAGLKLYDWLSGRYSFGRSSYLSREAVLQKMPGLSPENLVGGIVYYDGTFDDARLAINMAQTCIEKGATILNYAKVSGLTKNDKGKVIGLTGIDLVNQQAFEVRARVVINATGVFADQILSMNDPRAQKMIRPSQGVHLVIDRDFLDSQSALMIPKTADNRVLFAIPWHDHLLIGTTDTPIDKAELEPNALEQEIDFILDTASHHFKKPVSRKDIKAMFAGLRPLAAPGKDDKGSTKELSRDHKIIISTSGLITITGGKWTTYRKMAEDTVDAAIRVGQLKPVSCQTKDLPIHGSNGRGRLDDPLAVYGSDQAKLKKLEQENPEWSEKLHPAYPYTKATVIWAIRHEMAYTVEDVLSRRLRLLFMDTAAAIEIAETVAILMAEENGRDQHWVRQQVEDFKQTAAHYLPHSINTVQKLVAVS